MTYRNRTYSQGWGRPIREDKAGNIYYLRLKTPLGPMYKLGFTTSSTAHERLSYQGKGHEKLIDAVLGFAYSPNALSIEQTLHGYFDSKQAFFIPDAQMPFAGNGQSELYAEDILGMDQDFTPEQTRLVRAKIQAHLTGQSLHSIHAKFEQDALAAADVRDVMNLRFTWPINWIWSAWCLIEKALFTDGGKSQYKEKVQAMIHWYREVNQEAQRKEEIDYRHYVDTVLVDRQTKIDERVRVYALDLLQVPFQEKIEAVLEAVRDHKVWLFEHFVDLDRLVHNLAEAMTEDMTFGSDYMGVASNCDLIELIDAIADGHQRDILMVPVQEGYKTLLRHWVKTGELLSEDLPIPPDPLFYRTADGETHKVSPISTIYFGPSVFIEQMGGEWQWPQRSRMGDGTDHWVEFDIATRNAKSGFLGRLVVRAEPIPGSGKLEVSFPNFYAEYRRAINQSDMLTSGNGAAVQPQIASPELKALLREVTGFGRPVHPISLHDPEELAKIPLERGYGSTISR